MSDEKTKDIHAKVQHWPFARDYLQANSDAALIENHAISQLSGAINIGSLVAFVGSGISMAYGRLSWAGLVQAMFQRTIARATQLEKGQHWKANPAFQLRRAVLKNLGFDENAKTTAKADSYPTAFQQCELLWEDMRNIGPDGAESGRSQTMSFRDLAANLLYDDTGHAQTEVARFV